MRKAFTLLFTLLLLSFATDAGAQSLKQSGRSAQMAQPHSGAAFKSSPMLGGPIATPPTVTCGPDTVQYPLAKATGLPGLNINSSVALSQWYPAPQSLTISGFTFYAWVDSLTSQTVTITCELFTAGNDSFPTGAALATQTIVIDSNFYNGNLGLLAKHVTFTTPVTTANDYVLVVTNPSGINTTFVTNDYNAGTPDGLQEWLASVNIPGLGWLHTNQLVPVIGSNLDCDIIMMPHVTYQVTSSFTPSSATACTGDTVYWTNTSSPILFSRFYNQAEFIGQPELSTEWDYGDGSPLDYIIDGKHAYSTAGTYTVTLNDTMYGWSVFCADVSTGSVTVSSGTPVVASYSNSIAGLQVTFTDGSTGTPTSWSWDFGDGNTSTLQNPTHTYATGGTYTVCLIASNSCGSDTTCMPVTVAGCTAPIANWSNFTNGNTVDFTDLSTNVPTSWLWDFGDGNTSTQQNPQHIYATTGTYTVCLTVTNACGTDSTCMTVVTGCTSPLSNFNYTSSLLQAIFVDQSSGTPTSWFWDFGDGNTSTQQNPTHSYATQGSYTVCLTVTNACGPNTSCQTVVISCPPPNTSFTYTQSQLAFTFSDNTTGGPIGWSWDFGDGNTSTQQNPSHTYTAAGTYLVCLSAWNACDTVTSCVSVNAVCPTPNPNFSYTSSLLTASFTNSSTGGATTYVWDFGDGNTSTQQNPTHTYASGGTYTVCLVAINSCGPDTLCQNVTVSCPTPAPAFTFLTTGNVVDFTDGSSNATGWFWDFGDGNSSTQQNPSHTYTSTGTFTACLVVSNICGSDTLCQSVIISCTPPTAGFNFTQQNDSTVNFTNTSSANSTNFMWDFGDGSTSTQPNNNHTYSAPGVYVICLTVVNNCGSSTTCQTVDITACSMPTAGFNASVTNSDATFTDQSISAQSWAWDFGDGSTSTLASPTHTYTASGTYQVCLTVTNFCGSNTSCQNLFVVCQPPQANFTAANGTAVVNFTDNSSNSPTAWLWDFGDGATDTLQNPSHAYSFAGDYWVCLRTENPCGHTDTCMWVTVTTVGIDDPAGISFQVYPNPGDGLFQLSAEFGDPAELSLRVYNALGQVVYLSEEGMISGSYHGQIDLQTLARGVYYLEASTDDLRIRRKLVVE